MIRNHFVGILTFSGELRFQDTFQHSVPFVCFLEECPYIHHTWAFIDERTGSGGKAERLAGLGGHLFLDNGDDIINECRSTRCWCCLVNRPVCGDRTPWQAWLHPLQQEIHRLSIN